MSTRFEAISLAVRDHDDKTTVKLVAEAIADGIPAMDILGKGLVPGVQALGGAF